jgi:hypothetical protein
MFSLQRVYAYAVLQQRGVGEDDFIQPTGGTVRLTSGLQELVTTAFKKVEAGVLTSVDFDISADRQHPVRDDLLTVAFGLTKAPRTAALRIAVRLSASMDNRSRAGLVLLAAEADADDVKRRVSLLLLPREDVVQLNDAAAEDVLLELLKNAFSTASELRKFARVEGHNSRTQFLSADILDLEDRSSSGEAADFWIKDFLIARPRMNSDAGSRLLAAALRRAFEAAPENSRDATFAAMHKAGSGLVKRTTLAQYADNELPLTLHEQFFRGLSDDVRRTAFQLNPQIIKEKLGRRIFETKDGVIVSAPADVVGGTVRIKDNGRERTVSYVGVIKKESVSVQQRGRARKAAATAKS